MPTMLIFAFVAGLLTVASPCVLPVVPVLFGAGGSGRVTQLLAVVTGFGVTFVLTTVVLASALAQAGVSTDGLRVLSAIAFAGFGLAIAVPRVGRLVERLPVSRPSRALASHAGTGFVGNLILGSGIGLIWAPCVGPVMAVTIAAAVSGGPTAQTTLVALSYVAGAAIPLAGVALAGRRVAGVLGSARRRQWALRIFGASTLVAGLTVASGLDIQFAAAASGWLPTGLVGGLTGVEPRPAALGETSAFGQPSAPASRTDDAGRPLPSPISPSLPGAITLEDLGPAPEISGITDWINSKPLSIAQLRGDVVLVEFWTFACINCVHVQPYVKAWDAKYADSGLVVIGVHTPELSFERDIGNVEDAVAKAGLRFPIAFDPSFATWNAYRNNYWPAFYFIDRSGRIRHVHFGEGDYDGSEQVIRQLLAE